MYEYNGQNRMVFSQVAETSAGFGGGTAGSVTATFGVYESIDAARGPYLEFGGSGSLPGSSVGVDLITDINLNAIGGSLSVGIGTPGGEGHARAGVSGFFSLMDLIKK
jgi:hypothetical protein